MFKHDQCPSFNGNVTAGAVPIVQAANVLWGIAIIEMDQNGTILAEIS